MHGITSGGPLSDVPPHARASAPLTRKNHALRLLISLTPVSVPRRADRGDCRGARQNRVAVSVPTAVPSTKDWPETVLPDAKLAVRLPPGATVVRSGYDGSMGRYVQIHLASGIDFQFCDRCSSSPISISETRAFYENRAIGFRGYLYEAEDAVIAKRHEAEPLGDYCETTVCGAGICAEAVGATEDEHGVTKATAEECFEVVAIARSLRSIP